MLRMLGKGFLTSTQFKTYLAQHRAVFCKQQGCSFEKSVMLKLLELHHAFALERTVGKTVSVINRRRPKLESMLGPLSYSLHL